MRIALLGDIHGNLPALEAVLDEIDGDPEIGAVYHLGDVVGYGPWPNEVAALLRTRGIAGVSGNYDSTVAYDAAHCGCRYEDPRQEELSHASFEWTKGEVTPDTVDYLRSLPFRMELRPEGSHRGGQTVFLMHGSPVANTQYWTEDRPDTFCLEMAGRLGARPGDTICFGHTHLPWTREAGGIRFLNVGSVGRPKDGDWRAGFVMLETVAPGGRVEFRRCEYELARAQEGIRAGGLPADFADHLAWGGTTPR